VFAQARVAPEPLSPLHPTQVFVAVSQNAVAPVHALVFVAVQATHAPATHAGAALVGHGSVVAVPRSPVHCSHPPDPASVTQTGNAETQSLDVTQG
jgi:hypothetical protein